MSSRQLREIKDETVMEWMIALEGSEDPKDLAMYQQLVDEMAARVEADERYWNRTIGRIEGWQG